MSDSSLDSSFQALRGSRPKVVIGHPRIGKGGSEARVLWLVETLKRDFDVTVMTTEGWNLPELNAYFGTQIRENEVKVRIAPVPPWARNLSVSALRGACYQRFAREIAGEYDLRISAYNMTDWGLPAIHFIADFSWHRELRERYDPPSSGFIYRNSPIRWAYLKMAAAYGLPSGRDVLRDDVVIANSRWSAALMKQYCGVDCAAVMYPPVASEFPIVPWNEKENSFVMIGRVAPEKRIEKAIKVLDAVRQRGHLIKLHLCGHIGNDSYGQKIARLCRQHRDWIVAEGEVSGERKASILAAARFGIQTRAAEPFGISVAEMVKAGAIVFTPDDGGQTEVVESPDLLFRGVDEALDKILAVLSSEDKQSALRAHLAKRSEMFNASKFTKAARELIHETQCNWNAIPALRDRPKVVIGHPKLGYGGSESAVMWLIEALKRDFDVTVMTTGGWDLPALNAFYETHIREDEVKVRIAPVPYVVRRQTAAALRGACYQRFAREIAGEYDIRISAYNMTDWGLPAIHFIADFSWHQDLRERFDPPTPGFIYKKSLLRQAYLKIAAAYGRPSGRDVLRDDVLIANSRWSAELMKQYCGVDCAAVVYPPVATEFPVVPWDEKEQSFVMIGRVAPEKRIERAIEILDAVRQRGNSIKLHLCGQIDNDLYGQTIARLCEEHRGWIIAEGEVTGQRKASILATARFGIQTRSAEPFGISVAEMVKAGAIVFTPDDGGQTEVVGSPDLLFKNKDEAVDKICAVIASDDKQSVLAAHLAERSKMFTTERFMNASQAVLASSFPFTSMAPDAKMPPGKGSATEKETPAVV